jgi:hypothetical protein
MRYSFVIISLFTSFLIACDTNDKSSYISYQVLNDFLKTQKLYQRFDIQNINIEDFHLRDSVTYNNKVLNSRFLSAFYAFRITGKSKELLSKAEVASTDSVHWEVRLLTLIEEENKENLKYKKIYEWKVNKDSVNYSTQEFSEKRQ